LTARTGGTAEGLLQVGFVEMGDGSGHCGFISKGLRMQLQGR
jgi:hypothetical protein